MMTPEPPNVPSASNDRLWSRIARKSGSAVPRGLHHPRLWWSRSDQAVGVRVGQRPQQDSREHAEQRRRRADAEGDDDDLGQREAWRSPEAPRAVSDVLAQFLERARDPAAAFDPLLATNGDACS